MRRRPKAAPAIWRGSRRPARLAAISRTRSSAASGLFLPGLVDERLIARACAASPLPVNIMAMIAAPPADRLAELGVARISHAGGPWRLAMRALKQAAEEIYG